MGDPSMIPEGTGEIAKFGASSGFGSLFTLLVSRLFRGQDKASDQILAELKALTASVGTLSSQFAVLASNSSRFDTDMARLEATVIEQGKAIAALQATVTQIREGLIE